MEQKTIIRTSPSGTVECIRNTFISEFSENTEGLAYYLGDIILPTEGFPSGLAGEETLEIFLNKGEMVTIDCYKKLYKMEPLSGTGKSSAYVRTLVMYPGDSSWTMLDSIAQEIPEVGPSAGVIATHRLSWSSVYVAKSSGSHRFAIAYVASKVGATYRHAANTKEAGQLQVFAR